MHRICIDKDLPSTTNKAKLPIVSLNLDLSWLERSKFRILSRPHVVLYSMTMYRVVLIAITTATNTM